MSSNMSSDMTDKITAAREIKNDHDRLFNIIRNAIDDINATLPGTNQLGVCMSVNAKYSMLQSIQYNLECKSDMVFDQYGKIIKSRYGNYDTGIVIDDITSDSSMKQVNSMLEVKLDGVMGYAGSENDITDGELLDDSLTPKGI